MKRQEVQSDTETVSVSIVLFFVILIVFMALSGCSGVPYSSGDKIAMGVFVGSAFADYYTADSALDRGAKELYSIKNSEGVAILSLAKLTVGYLLGEVWPYEREPLFYFLAGTNGAFAIKNKRTNR